MNIFYSQFQTKKRALLTMTLVFGLVLVINFFVIPTASALTWDGSDCPTCDISYTSCPPGCTDECSYFGQRTCADSTHYKTCGSYDCDTCLEWSSSFSCSAGQVCQSGQCINSCSDECSYFGQKRCYNGTSYQTCGSYDSDACLEWSSASVCAAGQICQSGDCITQCTTHNYKSCYDNDVYWYNSCQQREDIYQDCGSDSWTSNYQCSGNWVQRQKTLRGCSGASCYSNTQWENYQDCAASGQICQSGQCVYTELHVSCNASPNPAQLGQTVVFSANATGGSGSYTYLWTNACSGPFSTCSTSFPYSGSYTATITVSSGGQSASTCCSVNINEPQCQCGNWGYWQNQGCGNNGCSSTQMYQIRTRTCSPSGCSSESESRCTADSSCQPTCQDECAFIGQTTCVDNGSKKTCGNYDSDSCLEWSTPTSCGTDSCIGSTWRDYYCSGGICSYSDATCSTHCYSCGNGVCDSACGENQYNCSQDCGQTCQSECAFSGQTKCAGNNYRQICGNYDSDSCLEWSPVESCSGATYCGYGNCADNQRPNWYCSGGICEYTCNYDSSCGCGSCNNCNNNNCNNCNNCYNQRDHKQCYNNDVYWYDSNNSKQDIVEDCGNDYCTSWGSNYCIGNNVYQERICYYKSCSGSSCQNDSRVEKSLVQTCGSNRQCQNGQCASECECTSGPCCDGCHYKSSSAVCNSGSDSQYGCPWGVGCGADVGSRTRVRFQYCSGNSAVCDGNWGAWNTWTSWKVTDYCSSDETCWPGNQTCSYNANCITPPPTPTNIKQCYDNDIYWFSTTGDRLSKYLECSDNNSCTLDGCEASQCFKTLKCDGSTCLVGSADYCSNCQHCGDGIANCDETFCACPSDVKLPSTQGVAISSLVKKTGLETNWKKDISVKPGDKISLMVIVASSGVENIDQLRLESLLPDNLTYQGNLKINDAPSLESVISGVNLGSLTGNTSKVITFDVKVAGANSFITGGANLNVINTIHYGDNKSTSDSVSIEVATGTEGAAAAGTIFGQMINVIGSLAFWLVMLFLIILIIVLSLAGFYWMRQRRKAEFAQL